MDDTVTRYKQSEHVSYILEKFDSKCIFCGKKGCYYRVIDARSKVIRFSKNNGIVLCDIHSKLLDSPLDFIELLQGKRGDIYDSLIWLYT
jgi:hypothetical protein